MPYIQLSKYLDSWSLFTLEQLSKQGYADVVMRALLCWLPSTNLSRSAACELSTLQNPNTGKYSFDTFIHSLEGYANVDDVLGELTETVVELIVADILVMLTTYTGGDAISDDMAQHLIYTAFSGLLRPVRSLHIHAHTHAFTRLITLSPPGAQLFSVWICDADQQAQREPVHGHPTPAHAAVERAAGQHHPQACRPLAEHPP
jgi:hypothetical protein